MKDFLDLAKIVTIAAFLPLLTFGIPLYFVGQYECREYRKQTGTPTKYHAGSCYLQDERGRWYMWEEWKLRNATKGH